MTLLDANVADGPTQRTPSAAISERCAPHLSFAGAGSCIAPLESRLHQSQHVPWLLTRACAAQLEKEVEGDDYDPDGVGGYQLSIMVALGADSVPSTLLGMTSQQANNMLRLQRNGVSAKYKPLAIIQCDWLTRDMVHPALLRQHSSAGIRRLLPQRNECVQCS